MADTNSGPELSHPVIRTGYILQSEFNIDSDLAMRARSKIEQSVATDGGEYAHLIENFDECGVNYQGKIGQHENFHWHDDGRPILDSPESLLLVDQFLIAASHSLTICSEGKKSKLWSRYTLISFNGEYASSISPDVILNFYNRVKTFSDLFLTQWKEIYLRDLESAGFDSTKFVPYPYEIKGVNYAPSELMKLKNSLANGLTLTEQKTIQKHNQATHTLTTLATAALLGKYENNPSEAIQRLRVCDPVVRVLVHEWALERDAVDPDSLTSIFLMKTSPEGATTFGASSMDYRKSKIYEQLTEYNNSSNYPSMTKGPAHEATGKILEQFASKF